MKFEIFFPIENTENTCMRLVLDEYLTVVEPPEPVPHTESATEILETLTCLIAEAGTHVAFLRSAAPRKDKIVFAEDKDYRQKTDAEVARVVAAFRAKAAASPNPLQTAIQETVAEKTMLPAFEQPKSKGCGGCGRKKEQ
jgi:hypothetical protein